MKTMTPPLEETWQAAVERREARRNHYELHTDADRLRARMEGRELPRMSVFAPEFREPATAAEFFDQRIIERGKSRWSYPETAVLVAIAAAARESAQAAAEAVRAARDLDKQAQWTAYQNLLLWRKAGSTGDVDRIMLAVLGEWSRLRLAETDPDEGEFDDW